MFVSCLTEREEEGGMTGGENLVTKVSQETGETTPVFTIAKSSGWVHSIWDPRLNWANQPMKYEHSNVSFHLHHNT